MHPLLCKVNAPPEHWLEEEPFGVGWAGRVSWKAIATSGRVHIRALGGAPNLFHLQWTAAVEAKTKQREAAPILDEVEISGLELTPVSYW